MLGSLHNVLCWRTKTLNRSKQLTQWSLQASETKNGDRNLTRTGDKKKEIDILREWLTAWRLCSVAPWWSKKGRSTILREMYKSYEKYTNLMRSTYIYAYNRYQVYLTRKTDCMTSMLGSPLMAMLTKITAARPMSANQPLFSASQTYRIGGGIKCRITLSRKSCLPISCWG